MAIVQDEQLLAQLARDAHADEPQLVAAILQRLRETLPEFFADPDVAYDMATAVEANVRQVGLLLEGTGADRLPAAAADLLQSTLQHGIPLISLLEAYRAAQGIATDWWLLRLEKAAPPHALPAARRRLTALLTGYIDTAASDIHAAYEVERTALERSPDGRRAHLVRKLLDGERLDVDAAARTLDHPLRGRHVALVLWRTGGDAADDALDDALADLAQRLAPARLLTTSARHRVYAWLSTTGALDLGAVRGAPLPPGVAAAAAGAHEGIDGFVRAHEEAVRTAGLARDGAATGRVVAHDDLELAVLLSRDADARDRFVRRVLGPLADETREAARARETLRTHLASGTSAGRAAARLGVHRNTIAHRLAALPPAVRAAIATDDDGWEERLPRRLELEVALLLHAQLGAPVG